MSELEEKTNIMSIFEGSSSNIEVLNALEAFLIQQKKKLATHNIPLSIFANKLGILEATVKYLKENQHLELHQIAILLNRDQRTIWNSYNKASKKHEAIFTSNGPDYIDVSIFHNRDQAPLQAVVKHLRDKGLSFKKIAELVHRNYKTVWLTYRSVK